MRAIISPAKKMRDQTDAAAWSDLPVYLDRAEVLKDWICGLTYAEQKAFGWSSYAFDEVRSTGAKLVFARDPR